MGRKSAKARSRAKPRVARKPPKTEDSRVRELENRLAESREREKALGLALSEASEQQRATSEILRIISRSQTDLPPVLDAIATNAALVCDAYDAVVFLRAGDGVRSAAHYGPINITLQHASLSRGSVVEAAILDRQPVHVPDSLATEPPAFPLTAKAAREGGFRTVLSVPLLRENEAIGALAIRRREVQPFTDQQIELLKTFADQAVIAIENVRLFNETKEALERQTATAEILRVISESPTDVQPVFQAIAERARQLCKAQVGATTRLEGELVHLAGVDGPSAQAEQAMRAHFPVERQLAPANIRHALAQHGPYQITDVRLEPGYPDVAAAERMGVRSILSVPLLHEGRAIGTIGVARGEPGGFADEAVALLQTFARQAVIAIENVRLFHETREALEQQTATSEILRVISSSPTDLQPVLDTVAERAASLCGASDGGIFRVDGAGLRLVAHHAAIPAGPVGEFTVPLTHGTAGGRAVLERRLIHVTDLQKEVDDFPEGSALARRLGHRTILSVPLLRDDVGIGCIQIRRSEVQPFTQKQVELLQSFADQAVIAIENVRLFKELESRNRDLIEALEQQTATSDILRVISSSPTDVQPVFDTIVKDAVRLCDATMSNVQLFDGEQMHFVAQQNISPETMASIRQLYPQRPDRSQAASRAILARSVVHLPDVLDDPEYDHQMAVKGGWRSVLSVPMLRGGNPIGTITVAKRAGFTGPQIALLQTFADQAVIAIENARLFTELQEKNRALTEAHAQVTESLEQQTATSEILQVISSSPIDIQPVLDAVAERAAKLCDATDAIIRRVDADNLPLAAHFGPDPVTVSTYAITRKSVMGRAVLECRTIHVHDITSPQSQSEFVDAPVLRHATGHRTMLAVPLLREGRASGVIIIRRREVRPFSETQIKLLQTFADQAVIAIENVRLFTELQASNKDLREALEQQRASAEVLNVISNSVADTAPVFDAIGKACQKLFSGDQVVISLVRDDGQVEHASMTTSSGWSPEIFDRAWALLNRGFPRPLAEAYQSYPMRKRRVVHYPDMIDGPHVPESMRQMGRDVGNFSMLIAPMLWEGRGIGTVHVVRVPPRPFDDKEHALLASFADQAVIAIQNARLFREIAEKSRQLEVASQHKSEFLANMSHELRTPLNAIIGFSEVLTERMFGELNDKQDEYLRDIYASGQHLLSLINDILDLSKIEAGRMELELTEFDLPTAIDNALTLVRERAGRHGIALHHEIDARLGHIHGDERKLKQVLLNLLSNAIKFTPEGGRIDVRASLVDGMVEVSVADTGVGIAPEDQDAVFEEFRQVGTAAKKVEGTGLGLTLSRKFVELHGGRIGVKSQLGAGTTFTFAIPVRPGE